MRQFIEAVGEGDGCRVHYPPDTPDLKGGLSVFLAGTIDMGNSEDWQTEVTKYFRDHDIDFLNPRREEWDSSWEQDISNPNFRGQVDWEMDWMEKADIVVMYFAPESQSPITLAELGLASQYPDKVIVACPEGFWRRGNVQIICDRLGIELVETLEDLMKSLEERYYK